MESTWIAHILRPQRLALSLCLAAVGCGAQGPGDEIGESAEEVVAGATNISDGIVPNSMAQSETAAVAMGGNYLAVAYNSASSAPFAGERCLGYSQIGMSYFNNNATWRGIHFSAGAAGMATLRGDPSVAFLDNGSDFRVFVSTLAHSMNQWNPLPKLPDGCVTRDVYATMQVDNLCLITVSVPKNGATASVIANRCVSTSPRYDGSAATVINGIAYFSAWNEGSSILFYRSDGVQMASPLTSVSVLGHPIIVKNDPRSLIAPDSSGNFWVTTFNPANNSWGPPVFMGSGFHWGQPLPFGIRLGKEYAAVNVPGSNGPSTTWLFYLQADGRLVGMARNVGPAVTEAWHSRTGFSAFHPSVAVATIPNEFPPFTGFHGMLSYFDNGGNYGTAALNFAWVGTNQLATVANESPCPFTGYWGDYDEMVVQNDRTNNPTFVRAFTDSTAATCNPGADWDPTRIPQHVSIIGHAKF